MDISIGAVIFYFVALVLVVSAAGVAFSPNIVYSAFSLVGTFGGVAGLYVLLGADFVAGVQILIYVGGIL
ncbi:MAG TPA: NADH-quinone oxidoreductase subunit J, partial [Candidatus Binatia bacterium]